MMSRLLIATLLTAMALAGAPALAQEVPEAGTAEREEKNVSMSEPVYRKLSAVHELMGENELDEAMDRLRSLLDSRLNDYERALVLQSIGFVYSQRGDYGPAIDYFEQCIELDALPNIAQQGMLYSLASLYASQEEFRKTIDTLTTWFKYEQEPKADAYMLMASAYAELEEYLNALPWVQKAIELSEEPKESWYQLELAIYFETKQYEAAIPHLQEMVAIWPDTLRYWETLSSAYMQVNKDAEALAALTLAYKRGLVEEERQLLNLVKLNLFLEIPFKAGEILEREMAAGRIETNMDNLELLLSAWTSAREFDRAIAVIDRLAPQAEDGEYYLQKAQLLAEKSEWQQAMEAARQAIDKGGLDKPGTAWLLVGSSAAELGRFDVAERAFREARNFDDQSRRNAESWLAYVADRRQVAAAN
jgi:tetratricopeptide (TPR) repeat protein